MISAIVCVDENWGIGRNNQLLVHIPEDMKFFKEKTANSVVIMGRKTYDSLPVKPLPYRLLNVIVTSKVDKMCECKEENGRTVCYATMDFIKTYLKTLPQNDNDIVKYFVIGGGQIYKELLPYCSKVYVTKVNHAYENANTYFPNIDNMLEWKVTSTSETKEHNGIEYQFCTYEKKEVVA